MLPPSRALPGGLLPRAFRPLSSCKGDPPVRDPDRWFQSFSDTILHFLSEPVLDHLADWGAMVHKAILERVFDGNVADRPHVIASYERHNEAVKLTIPLERLLVYEVSDGGTPLSIPRGTRF